MNVLEKVTLGEHYFSTAGKFIHKLSVKFCKIWYDLTRAEINKEDLDLSLLLKILNVTISVPAEALYLKLGILNLEAILKARRINHLHYSANQNPESMLFKCFISQ